MWELLGLFVVVIVERPLLERACLRGIIGLLLGGSLIGLISVHRRAVVIFALAAFAIPMLLGSAIGFSLH